MPNKQIRLSDRAEASVLEQIVVRLIERHEQDRWDQLVSRHHYLKNANLVGERLCYVVEYAGQWLALLGWSAAAYHIGARDQWIGWSDNQRRAVQGEYRAWARRQRRARDSACPASLEKMSRRVDSVLRYLLGDVSGL